MPDSWMQGPPRRAMYSVQLDSGSPAFIADTDARLATWREDGQIVALSRARDGGTLELATATPGRSAQHLIDLPVRTAETYAAAWSSERGNLLIGSAGADAITYWLVRLAVEERP